MGTLSLTKEARIYNGLKTISLTSGSGKTGQLPVKEWNWNTFLHHTEEYIQNWMRKKQKILTDQSQAQKSKL